MRKILKVALFCTGLFSTMAVADVVKVGILAPVSGANAAEGEEFVNGARLAVDEINKKGGVAGYTIELVVGDTGQSSAAEVSSATERLLGTRGVEAILTAYASGTNFEIDLMAEQDMPYLISGNPSQTKKIIGNNGEDFPTVWSMVPEYTVYHTDLIPIVEKLQSAGEVTLPNKKIAIISSDFPYSKNIASQLRDLAPKQGWQVTEYEMLPFGEIHDWRAFLSKVRQDPPAIIINTDWVPANAAKFVEQFLEKPTDSLVFIQYAPSVPEFTDLLGDKAESILYNIIGSAIGTPAMPRTKQIKDKYQAKFGQPTGGAGVSLYEMMYIYADALAKVGDPSDRLAIGKALGETSAHTAMGKIEFYKDTHLPKTGDMYLPTLTYQIQNGKRILFNPAKYANGKFIKPRWKK